MYKLPFCLNLGGEGWMEGTTPQKLTKHKKHKQWNHQDCFFVVVKRSQLSWQSRSRAPFLLVHLLDFSLGETWSFSKLKLNHAYQQHCQTFMLIPKYMSSLLVLSSHCNTGKHPFNTIFLFHRQHLCTSLALYKRKMLTFMQVSQLQNIYMHSNHSTS